MPSSRPKDMLADWVVGRTEHWSTLRDNEHKARWDDYYSLWRGIWSSSSRNRNSERSRAIMPTLSQAVESAVSEMVEALFGREIWFDSDGEEFRQLADQLRADLWHVKQPLAEIFLMGAVYGTGIGKIVIDSNRPFRQRLQPIDPLEFIIDPAACSIDEAMGVAHSMFVPANVVHKRQRDGVYDKIELTEGNPDTTRLVRRPNESTPTNTDIVHLVEWHGLVPREMLDDGERDGLGDENLVEAIVTVANQSTVLRAVANPLGDDRGFVAYQHDIVPRRFWGRGVMEKGWNPQKVLDAEIRARIDALAYSVHPMMGINQLSVPRGQDFEVRPGRNIFIQGNPAENISPISFNPPDPQTYQQAAEMQRLIEMGTGQIQAAAQSIDTRNAPASGISMIFGAQVRRTKRALGNIERSLLDPLIRKMFRRHLEFDRKYPNDISLSDDLPIRFRTGLGMMAREFEVGQLTTLLQSLPPGPAQLALVNLVLENSSLIDKEAVIAIVNQGIAEQLSQGERDLSGEARMISAVSRAEEGVARLQLEAVKLQQKQEEMQKLEEDRQRRHQEAMTKVAVGSAETEARILEIVTKALKNVADAEAAEAGTQIEEYKAQLGSLSS